MSLVEYLESVVYGERRDIAARFVNGILIGLSGVYQASLWLYLLPYKVGIRKRHKLGRPVISVGNITVGGTGKTPTVQYLCRGLSERGFKPAILSYGYGGQLVNETGVVSDRDSVRLTPDVAGDEPYMLARSMPGVPILVGKDRHITGRRAIDEMGADVLLLDDGFQVWKLHRDIDIVLVKSDRPFDNRRTLPAGMLREPVDAISRADCLIVTGGPIPEELRVEFPTKPIFSGYTKPVSLTSPDRCDEIPIDLIAGKRVFAMSAIGNPQGFEKSLTEIGADLVGGKRFPDHHSYSEGEVSWVNNSAEGCNAEAIITTEKDGVKLVEMKFSIPIYALKIRFQVDDEELFWRLITEKTRNRID